jgi:HlyD family secretion protein
MNENGGQRYVGQRHANRTRETFHVNAKRLLGAKNVCLAILGAAALAGETAAQDVGQVAALGRLEPRGGVVRVAAPSTPLSLAGSVVAELFVREGEDVSAGQLLALSDAAPALQAAVQVADTELTRARQAAEAARSKADEACVIADVLAREAARRDQLLDQALASQEEAEQARGDAQAQAASCSAARVRAKVSEADIDVAAARRALREAELARTRIEAPFAGRVLRITAEPGEYVGPEGILELGRVQEMMAIAEVFETDVRHIARGQAATVSSDALEGEKTGRVAFIRPKVQKQDEIGTDPAARKDARIVEVGIALDDPGEASNLTNLQVEVVITP